MVTPLSDGKYIPRELLSPLKSPAVAAKTTAAASVEIADLVLVQTGQSEQFHSEYNSDQAERRSASNLLRPPTPSQSEQRGAFSGLAAGVSESN